MKEWKYNCAVITCVLLALFGLVACGDDDNETNSPIKPNTDKEQEDSLFSFAGETIYEMINSQRELSNFAFILKKAGYDKLLSTYGTYTVFAPKNDGISAYIDELYNDEYAYVPHNGLSSNSLEGIPDSMCERIAKQHLITVSAISISQLENIFDHTVTYLNANNEQVLFSKTVDGKCLLNNRAIVTQADIKSTNGFLNVLDKTLYGVSTRPEATENYAELKERESRAINDFVQFHGITIISESQFKAQNYITNVSKNEFVLFDNIGVCMQIVRKGCGTPLQKGETRSAIVRFKEQNILDTTVIKTNMYDPYNVDKMTITYQGESYVATFTEGTMYSTYGTAVPPGWLTFLPYVNIGRPSSPEDEIAKVHLIVPHIQGHSYSQQNVLPYYYEITLQ